MITALVIGGLMDKSNPFRILPASFALGFASLVFFGWFASGSLLTVVCTSIICGIFITGGQTGHPGA